ncbi:hypothetical protein [Bradyrhizobium macuxiense]|uniref:hypothetical protein n=1 Tax=Bradyrhizobium macuxiense TaxID=1755647 RepID=UPI001AECC472|nr:hypothetical protein [Bradyrhizobium macuxiense]
MPLHSRVADVREAHRVACHEAAHAILRWCHGRTIDRVSVVAIRQDGRTINGRCSGDIGDLESDHDYYSRIVELVGGNAGEVIHLGEGRGLRGSDQRKVNDYAASLTDNVNARSLIIRAAEIEAEHLLRKHEQAFRALVDALLARSVLTGRQVTEIIEANQ